MKLTQVLKFCSNTVMIEWLFGLWYIKRYVKSWNEIEIKIDT